MNTKKTKIRQFLFEREGKYSPKDKAVSSLKRLEKIDFSGKIYLSDKASNTQMIRIKPGDLVISGINVTKGAMAVYRGDEDVAATIHYSSYTVDETQIDLEFLSIFLQSSRFIDLLKEQTRGGIKTEIKPKHLLALEIDLPTMEEQKRIVTFWSRQKITLDALYDEIERQSHYLKYLRQSLLQEAVSGRLTAAWRKKHGGGESGRELLQRIRREKERLLKEKKIKKEKPLPPIKPEEIPFDVPDSWTWCRLIDIVCEPPRNGYSPTAVNHPTATKTLKLSATTSGYFKKSEYKYINETIPKDSFLWLRQGDILIQRSNSLEYVGISALYTEAANEFIYPDLMMKIRGIDLIDPRFIHQCLLSPQTRNYFRDKASGAQKSMPKINQKTVSSVLIPLPPQLEQQEIVRQLDILQGDCNALEAEIRANEARAVMLQQSILRDAFGQDATPAPKPKKKPVAPPQPELLPIDQDTPKNRYALAVLLTLLEKKKTVSGQLLDGVWTRLASYDNIFNCLDGADKLRFRGMDKKYAAFFSAMKVDETIYWRDLLGPTIEQECISRDKSGVYSKARFFDRALSEFASDNLGPLVEFALSAYDRYMQLTSDPEPAKHPQGKRKTAHSIR